MEISSLFQSPVFSLIILPLLIFCSRIIDVSIGTMRLIFISRGYKFLAPLVGFFEVLIWLIVTTQIIKNLTNPVYYIAYAGGFATGNLVGILIEEKIALGTVLIRVVTSNDVISISEYLKSKDYGVTILDAHGLYGTVKILFTIIPRNDLDTVLSFIKQLNPQAFYTVEDVRYVNEMSLSYRNHRIFNFRDIFSFRSLRKSK